ncbi:tetratricopeptide repeat protein [Paraburkholderia sediminicola]|uniref:tetratricopeptide repeat protein n=1 Tax=Paraburkholderia sediminicola TaxID=458836 RepID=UPI0038BA71E3
MRAFCFLGLQVWRRQGGAYDAALAWLDAALTRAPENARYHFVRGQVFAAAQRFTEAIDAYLQALSFEAGSTDALFALAAALQAVGEYAAAIETYRSPLAFEPGHVDALNNAATLMRTLGRIAEAESHLREALTLEPHHSVTHNNLGRQRYRGGMTMPGEALGGRVTCVFPAVTRERGRSHCQVGACRAGRECKLCHRS